MKASKHTRQKSKVAAYNKPQSMAKSQDQIPCLRKRPQKPSESNLRPRKKSNKTQIYLNAAQATHTKRSATAYQHQTQGWPEIITSKPEAQEKIPQYSKQKLLATRGLGSKASTATPPTKDPDTPNRHEQNTHNHGIVDIDLNHNQRT